MTIEFHLIDDIAACVGAVVDSAVGVLAALYAAGAPGGIDPGPLVVGGAAGGLAGGAAAAGGDRGGGGSGWPPHPNPATVDEYRLGRSHFTDTSGNGYWPGISPIPADGIVHWTESRHPNLGGDRVWNLPVNPITGRPHSFPP